MLIRDKSEKFKNIFNLSPAISINSGPSSPSHLVASDSPEFNTSPTQTSVADVLPISVVNTHPMTTRLKAGISKPKVYSSVCLPAAESSMDTEPKSVKEALSKPHWHAAMTDEFQALLKNNTWSLVPFDSSMSLVGCKWVYRTKYKPNGEVLKHKARLVAKGFHQTPGIDFHDTFNLVLNLSSELSFGYCIFQI